MAVWFRHGSCTVGIDDGLIPARDFARLTSLLNAARSVGRERDRLTAAAQEEAAALRAEAEADAQALREAAQADRERAEREGWEEGYARGLNAWSEQAVRASWSKQQELDRQTLRLGDIVSAAVSHLLDEVDREALYRRALRNVVRILRDVPLMYLKVPESEVERARAAVDAVLAGLEGAPRIEVLADATLADGGCLFESELGIVDASLPVQLAAIRRAVARATQLVAQEAAQAEEQGEVAGADDAATAPEVTELRPDEATAY